MANAALIQALREGSLIAFLGAGVSRTYKDPLTGMEFLGLPTASEIVTKLGVSRPGFIQGTEPFPQACFLLRAKEGRNALERFLQGEVDKPTLKPLPAHTLCANLPFACYFTTNYDNLLEKALQEARRPYHVLITDDDVTRIRPDKVPVLKLHGCISSPASLIAADDEYTPLAQKTPIIEAFLKAQLANKTVVFLGFSLNDRDFKTLYEDAHRMLGRWMPHSYAVVNAPTPFEVDFWKTKGVELITEDLTAFLVEIIKESTSQGQYMLRSGSIHRSDEWLNNPFFSSLLSIRSLPSETQVINAFLAHLLNELRVQSYTLGIVIANARAAKDLVLQHRQNYVALQALGTSLLAELEATCGNDKDEAEIRINEVIKDRSQGAAAIRKRVQELKVIKKGANILIYSQSVRVIDVLKSVSRGVQDTCHIYIAECRPKSPESFQDALAVADNLKGTGYAVTIVPDAAIGNLIDRNQIDLALVGAHAVYKTSGSFSAFVNTCGTSLLLHAAAAAGVPVYVVAELFKHVEQAPGAQLHVSYEEEEAIFANLAGRLAELKATGLNVNAINIGYDLCQITPNIQVLSES